MYCGNCGELLNDDAQVCTKCGNKVKTATEKKTTEKKEMNLDFSRLSTYYQKEFQKIYDSGEQYKGKFNIMAFLFGPIWALTKGCWSSAIKCLVLSVVTGGVAGIIYWFIYGFLGTYIYYTHYVKKDWLDY